MASKKNLTTVDVSGTKNGGGSARQYLPAAKEYTDNTGTYTLTSANKYSSLNPNGQYNSVRISPDETTKTYYTGASLGTSPNTSGAVAGALAGVMNPALSTATNTATENALAGALAGTLPQSEAISEYYNNINNNNGGGNGGGSSYYDPSADLMAAYQARQAAAQQNYEMAREQLRRAYEDSVSGLRTQGEDALRQAYINMMMNKRGLGQSLEAAGLRGGATESALAGIYNNYANNRNSIARAVEEGLTNAGNVYGNNLANLGMNYNTNSADAMEDYQKQLISARQSLANTLAKTSSNSKGTSTDVITSTLKSFAKSPASARRYLSSIGITGTAADQYLWNAGIDPTTAYDEAQGTGLNDDYISVLKNFKNNPTAAKAYADTVGGLSDDYYWAAGINPSDAKNPLYSFKNADRVAILNSLAEVQAAARSNNNPNELAMINERMQQLARQYGLTDEQARAFLAEAGY